MRFPHSQQIGRVATIPPDRIESHKSTAILLPNASREFQPNGSTNAFTSLSNFILNSALDCLLRKDPSGQYLLEDEHTQALYHAAVHTVAKKAGLDAIEIASLALQNASAHFESAVSRAEGCLGYYLVGGGAEGFARDLCERRPVWSSFRSRSQFAVRRVFRVTVAITAAILLYGTHLALHSGRVGQWQVIILIVALPLIVSYASAFSEALCRPSVPARQLPRMPFHQGIPREFRTLIVVPVLVQNTERAETAMARLGRLGATIDDENVDFAVLSDFGDAPTRSAVGDHDILEVLEQATTALNALQAPRGRDRYCVFHRERAWSETQQAWIGWERKRGKLLEFIRLLATGEIGGDARMFGCNAEQIIAARYRYILALDEDTWMEADEIVDLIRTGAHPLNRLVIDQSTGRAASGFGIFQPTTLSVLPALDSSLGWPANIRQKVVSRASRIPWSEFRFDAFGSGHFEGKGLYDIAACYRLLQESLPDGIVLQHDFLEGFIVRTATVYDCSLVQPLPRGYLTQAQRGHRWIRGGMQALPWTVPWTRDRNGNWRANPVPAADRPYIAELALKYLQKPASLLMLLFAWTFLPGFGLLWLLAACPVIAATLASWAAYVIQSSVLPSGSRVENVPRLHRSAPRFDVIAIINFFVLLAYEAWIVCDAVARVLWRLVITRKHLLDWTPHAVIPASALSSSASYYREMVASPMIGIASLCMVGIIRPGRLVLAAPFAIIWILTPWIVYKMDRGLNDPLEGVSAQQ